MQNTTYFDLDIYEGSDIFNPLTVENENMEKIDEQMYLNQIAGIGQAVELKNGTVHALTRVNADVAMFRFVATSNFDAGDTFTVDGIQVTGLKTDGTPLDAGAYVINANVLCCLTGTVLTLFVASGSVTTAENSLKLGGELPAYYGKASDVASASQAAQAAGIIANNAIDIANDVNNKLLSFITTIEVNTSQVNVPANNHAVVAIDVSSNIPSGYKLLTAICSELSTGWVYCYGTVISNNTITVNLHNTYGNNINASAKLTLILIAE